MKKKPSKKFSSTKKNLLLFVVLGILIVSPILGNSLKKIKLPESFQVTVTGTILDENEMPLPGASVVVKGTTTGAVADFDGKYSINAPSNSTLVFSYVGYAKNEVSVDGRTTINIKLNPDASMLDEVVLVGYGTQKKGEVTGAIETVTAEQLSIVQVSSTIDAIKGQIAGVDVQSTGGRPGQNPTVRIRGRRSISASNDPLYVVDGIPLIDGPASMADINPDDIASMQVLKDAAATAVYGSRGANGVILVSTNRGRVGKTKITYSSRYGITSATRLVDMMNGEQFADLKRESRRDGWNGAIPAETDVFLDPIELESLEQGRSTNWLDKVVGNGYQTNHQLGISGGSENTTFSSSIGYFKEQGIISNQDFERISGRLAVDHKINDIFKVGASFLVSKTEQNYGSNATMGEALANNPLGIPYDENGNLKFLPTNDGIRTNPLNELVEGAYIDERQQTRIFAPIYLDINIAQGLKWTSTFGPDIRIGRRGTFAGSLTNTNRGGPGRAGIENVTDFGYTLENLLTYNKALTDRQNIKVTLLQSIQKSRIEKNEGNVTGIPYESQSFYNLGSATQGGVLTSGLTEWALASFMGRVNYDFDGKYLFQASLRADGSSRLAPGNQWKYFPGVSAGWRIDQEEFLADTSVNELKLRASYGQVGNTSVNPYQTAGRLGSTVYAFGESPALGFGLNEIPNDDLTWEVSKTLDIGLDYGFLNNRVVGSFDFFRTNTVDLLLARSLPSTSGYESVLQNVGATRTTGFEFTISTGIVDNDGDGFNWDVDLNISTYKEEITELALTDADGNALDDVGNGWFIGQPIQVFYDYEKIGIWQADEAAAALAADNKVPGEIKLNDLDGDGVITPEDRKILGDGVPDFYGGLNSKFSYKGIDLGIFFVFRQGQTIQSQFNASNNSLFGRYNNLNVDYWTIDNPTNANPRPNENQESPRNGSTLTYFDGSFVKLRNISLGYNLPESITSKLGMEKLRFSISGQNLIFWDDFPTFDPEISEEEDLSLGSSVVPSTKQFSLSLNATF
ncbi:TonB-dependent receptor [uncultured Maribacter sp.]|uniref:SusC/RagA family TonB-linked outer membrane protein n=1 Tax=uncultured Maribacter sp. TaxID=431308 RepID=UPI0030ED8DFD|tara:strand:+ start:34278 stop:37349 length:3072 start_codon:yes stop_codon:yes gene_type:complete